MAERAHHATRRPQPRAPRRRRVVVPILVGLLLVVVLFAFVYPTRTYMQQRQELDVAERRLEVLRSSSRTLARENARLESDAEVERRAREDYGLVRPGETPYVLVPAQSTWVP
jgi:cell division protein FtsB